MRANMFPLLMACLCLLGALAADDAQGTRRARSADQWLALVAELARLGVQGGARGGVDGTRLAMPPLTLPAPSGAPGLTTLQLVLLPGGAAARCPARAVPSGGAAQLSTSEPSRLPDDDAARVPSDESLRLPSATSASIPSGEYPALPNAEYPKLLKDKNTNLPGEEYLGLPNSVPSSSSSEAPPRPSLTTRRRVRTAPYIPPVEDSTLLLQQFLEEAPSGWGHSLPPPIGLEPLEGGAYDDSEFEPPPALNEIITPITEDSEKCVRACNRQASQRPARNPPTPADVPPPLPRFESSLKLEAVLTVPRAGYSEPYTMWWDAARGESLTEMHGGTTSLYRAARAGRLHATAVRLDRSAASPVRRCLALAPRRHSLAERALPALPNLAGFTFGGYVAAGEAARAERWVRAVRGAARGRDVLTYRHELLVARAPDNHTVTPLRYAVAVDSALLGDSADGYVHRFERVSRAHHDPALFQLNVKDACDHIDTTKDIHLVEALREFTMLHLDPRYDREIEDFKSQFKRQYADDLEEAIRKQILISSSRFASSGNRQGATFEMEVNYLADRLAVERTKLLGVKEEPEDSSEAFPHSAEELKTLRGRLPQKFSWVDLGGVTSVRNQYPCSSCWAFAVTGAVEGALFARTGRLVPLSEQAMVDCGKPYHTNGCSPTWPNFAYEYVKHRGLPPLDEYMYEGKVQQCRADSVPAVTRISGHVNVTANSVVALKVALRRHGPTVVLIDGQAPSLALYKGGLYSDTKCKTTSSNHAVLAVGWRAARGGTYFQVKNSWSAAWGEVGYAWLRGASNACGVLRRPSYPVLHASDVLRVPAAAQRTALDD